MTESYPTGGTDPIQTKDSLEQERAKYDNERPTQDFQAYGNEVRAFYKTSSPNQITLKPVANQAFGTLSRRYSDYQHLETACATLQNPIRTPKIIKYHGESIEIEYIAGLSFDTTEEATHPNRPQNTADDRSRLLTPEIRFQALMDLLSVSEALREKDLVMTDIKASALKYYKGETIIIDPQIRPKYQGRELRHVTKMINPDLPNWNKFIPDFINILGGKQLLGESRAEFLERQIQHEFKKRNINNPLEDDPRQAILFALGFVSKIPIPFKQKEKLSKTTTKLQESRSKRTKIIPESKPKEPTFLSRLKNIDAILTSKSHRRQHSSVVLVLENHNLGTEDILFYRKDPSNGKITHLRKKRLKNGEEVSDNSYTQSNFFDIVGPERSELIMFTNYIKEELEKLSERRTTALQNTNKTIIPYDSSTIKIGKN